MIGTLQHARALTDRDLSHQLLARGVQAALQFPGRPGMTAWLKARRPNSHPPSGTRPTRAKVRTPKLGAAASRGRLMVAARRREDQSPRLIVALSTRGCGGNPRHPRLPPKLFHSALVIATRCSRAILSRSSGWSRLRWSSALSSSSSSLWPRIALLESELNARRDLYSESVRARCARRTARVPS
jgi:hypothetical protein